MGKPAPPAPREYATAPAGKELRSWCDSYKITYKLLGELIGYAPDVIARWVSGWQRPRYIERIKIEFLTGVPRDHWLTDAERDEIRLAKTAITRLRNSRPVADLTAAEKLAGRI